MALIFRRVHYRLPDALPTYGPVVSSWCTHRHRADWNNTTLIRGDVAAEVTRLKQTSGKNIAMSGSATLVEWLLHAGLLDELRLFVHPIVVGQGRRLTYRPAGT